MASKAIRSRSRTRAEPKVKINPDEIPNLIAAARKAGADGLGLSDRAFDYWLAGNLPKAVRVLLDHPDLAAALWRDAERRALVKQLERE